MSASAKSPRSPVGLLSSIHGVARVARRMTASERCCCACHTPIQSACSGTSLLHRHRHIRFHTIRPQIKKLTRRRVFTVNAPAACLPHKKNLRGRAPRSGLVNRTSLLVGYAHYHWALRTEHTGPCFVCAETHTNSLTFGPLRPSRSTECSSSCESRRPTAPQY